MAITLAACSGGSGGSSAEDTQGGAPGASDGDQTEAPTQYRIGGRLSGLGDGKTVVLGDASGPRVSVSANGPYSLLLPSGAT
ncbi:MAG: hypothetical protein EOO31_11235, partial [Comamonadaceae bacterium]